MAGPPARPDSQPLNERQAIVPSPRTISDITAILRTEKHEDAAKKKRLIARTEQQPPADADPTTLARFYMKRGTAARNIGRIAQAIRDLTLANSLAADLSNRDRREILRRLGLTQIASGDRIRGIRHLAAAVAVANRPSYKVRWGTALAYAVAYHDLDEANRHLAEAAALMQHMRRAADADGVREWKKFRLRMQARLAYATGRVSFVAGKYSEAESHLRVAVTKFEAHLQKADATGKTKKTGGNPRIPRNHARMHLGLALLAQGRLLEAEIEVRKALLDGIKVTGPADYRVARYLNALSNVLLAQGRLQDAESIARASLDIQRRIGAAEDSSRLTQARLRLARALLAQGRWKDAVHQFDQLKLSIRDDADLLELRLLSNPDYALALMKSGDAAAAIAVGRRAFARREQLSNDQFEHPKLAIARGIFAMALSARGKDRQALEQFRKTTPALLAGADANVGEEALSRATRDQYTRLIFESYMELLARRRGAAFAAEINIDPVAEAFQLAESARGQTVQRALTASAARVAAGKPELTEMVRREQDLSNQIGALNRLFADMLARPAAQRTPAMRRTLPTKIVRLRAQHTKLRGKIQGGFPAYAALMRPKPPTFTEIRASLQPDEALIATYVGERATHVWAVPHSGPIAFAAVTVEATRIRNIVQRLRRSVTPASEALAGVPAFDVAAAKTLYDTILRPVAAGWRNAKQLIMVAHGPLSQVPFSMLAEKFSDISDGTDPLFSGYRKVQWLAQTHGVTSLPTVSALTTLRQAAPASPKRRNFAGFADPWFHPAQAEPANARTPPEWVTLARRGVPLRLRAAPWLNDASGRSLAALPRLPDTALEIKSIGAALKADFHRDLFLGPQANEQRIKSTDLRRYKVIAFASHALNAGELDGLTQPAIALSAPDVAGVAGDGLLTMEEILGLKLDADWVVLSACNTASGDGRGAEAVSGLGRAFFYAGARALLVTHWRVETESARLLVTDIFRRQARNGRLSRSEALRQAMLELIDGPGYRGADGRTLFSYAHPLFWAPFALYGEARAVNRARI